MKKISNQTIILLFIVGLILLTLFYFLTRCDQCGKKTSKRNDYQLKFLAPTSNDFKGPTSPPYVKGPTGPPPYSN